MPSSGRAKKAMLSFIPVRNGIVYELGSGWGGLALRLAKTFPEVEVRGIELSLIPFIFSRIFLRRKNLSFCRRDFLKMDLGDATGFVCYLFPKGMELLHKKLQKEGYRGFLVSNTFALPGAKASRTVHLDDLGKSKIYFYQL